MATISNNSLIQPVYVANLSQMASIPRVAGRLYYIADINALWLCTDDAGAAPSVGTGASAGVYSAGGGTFFGLAKGSALTGSNATPANLGITKPAGVPIIDTSWLPGTVDEIVEVYINRNANLNSNQLFYPTENVIGDPITPAPKTIYLVIGQTVTPPNTNNYASKVNHSFRWSGSQYVDLDNDQFTLNELTDVEIVSPSNGQALRYESATGKWKNAPLPTADATLGLSSLGIVLRTGTNSYSTRTLGSANQYLRMNSAGTAMEWGTFNVGVTSVGLQMPAGFKITGSPVTSVGVLKAELEGPLPLSNPVTAGTPSVILGAVAGDDTVSAWSFVVAPNSGYIKRGAAFYGADIFTPTEDPGTGATTYHFQTTTQTWRVRTGATGNTWTTVTSGFSSGTTLPASPNANDVFYKTTSQEGIYIYISGITGVADGSLYYNTTLNKIRLGKDGAYVSLVDEEDIASLYWLVA